jgi:hypothetical protein
MTAPAIAEALGLIETELAGIPESAREAVADRVLGALTGRFMLIPRPSESEEATTRAALEALGVPGLSGRGAA